MEIIKNHQEGITAQLESLKTELKIIIDNALKIFVVIKEHEPTLDVSELLKPFGIEPIEEKKPRNKKIGVLIAGILTEKGLTEKEVIEALPKLDKEKIIASLNSIKSKVKPGKRDSFIYKSNKYFPKK